MKIPAILLKDAYKVGHVYQYPKGTQLVYSNWTPRASRNPNINKVVFFGLQYFIKEYLQRQFDEGFFNRKKDDVLAQYKRRIDTSLGPDSIKLDHIAALHDLQFLPIKIMAVPEGTRVPLRVPMLTIENTLSEFYWLTNMLETLMSNILWMPCTSATTAYEYRQCFDAFAHVTGANKDMVPWQGHDFSMRGMSGIEAACLSGAAHLLSFTGTDTLPAIDFLEEYYNANCEHEMIGGSVPATEHSVMCVGSKDGEIDTFERLITETYPSGIVSVVSDTWDYWQVITSFLPKLKEKILARKGKLVIRPDSGDPVKIICGDPNADVDSPEYKGTIQCMWETFGGQVTPKGFKQLDPHIGLIYGDSITLERQSQILGGLYSKGFASDNVVLGIGSYTYQCVTRDTFGFAVKATYAQINGKPMEIFKDPKTDNSIKKSARGLLGVVDNNGNLELMDRLTVEELNVLPNVMRLVFCDGDLLVDDSLKNIRGRLK